MNFLEYLTEEREKDMYIIINTHNGYVPSDIKKEPYKTWAVSPEKAKYQIIFRLKDEPDKYTWKVLNDINAYEAIRWDDYVKSQEKPINYDEVPPIKMKEDPQMKLFDEPSETPY